MSARARILVVDDDELDRMAVRRLLARTDLDAELEELPDATAALERARAGGVDLVLTDFNLPGRNGLWLIGRIREEALDVPVVVLTGQGDEETAVALMKAGATDYLPKASLSGETLSRVLRNAMRVHAAEAEAGRVVAALHKSEQGLRIALDAADLGTFSYDVAADLVEWDARTRAVFGVEEAARIKSEDFFALVAEEDRPALVQTFRRQIEGTALQRQDAEFRVRRRSDGVERWIRASGRAIAQDGRVVRVIGVIQDFSDRRLLEEESRRQAEFEQQLVGIVSHDLRNPISAMTMSAALLLRREETDAFAAKVLARVVSAGERAARMIRDLLDLTRARASRGIPVEPKPVDLPILLRQTIEEIQSGHPDRTLTYTHVGATDGTWDPDRLAQIVTNLAVNAVTYSPPGTPVTVRTIGEEHRALLTVHNEGPPIPEHLRGVLFRPFRRGHDQTGGDRSIGLGLFIVKELVVAHGGTIDVDSAAGRGTTFSVTLPRVAPPRAGTG